MTEIILAGTGHRPPRLGLGYDAESRRLLREFTKNQVLRVKPDKIISGMAQGFDAALAEAAIELSIPFIAVIPFAGQERKWPASAQKTYNDILDKAIEVVTVCEGSYAAWKFIERDRWMVLKSNKLMALYDGKGNSGTHETVQFAIKESREIIYVWGNWIQFRGK